MSNMQFVLLVIVLGISVQVTRSLPFLIFRNSDNLPKIIEYLGKVLPAAMMGLLVIYCFKDYDFTSIAVVGQTLIAAAVVVGLHLWKRNTVLSIAAGTAVYMLLIRIM